MSNNDSGSDGEFEYDEEGNIVRQNSNTPYTEPNVYLEPENYSQPAQDDGVYSTELPSYNTQNEFTANPQTTAYDNSQYTEPQFADNNQYAAPNAQPTDQEGYVAADDYLETPATHSVAEQGYYADQQTEPNLNLSSEQAFNNLTQDMQSSLSGEPAPQYSSLDENNPEYGTAENNQQGYVQGEYATDPVFGDEGYSEPNFSAAPQFNESYNESHSLNADGQSPNAAGQPPEFDPGYDPLVSQLNADHSQAENDMYDSQYTQQPADGYIQEDFRQDFTQEYSPEPYIVARSFPYGAILSVIAIVLFGTASYFLYSNFFKIQVEGDVPVLLADKSAVKLLPESSVDAGTSADNLALSGDADSGQPTLSNSREDVVEQPIKSEDRIETSNTIVADNIDRDIQNVLTLINSSANNVEILLQPDEVSVIDQNQIGITGLETILVNAKPVTLKQLAAQNNPQLAQNNTLLAQNSAVNIEDLPVVSEGAVVSEGREDPFKELLEADDDASTAISTDAVTINESAAAIADNSSADTEITAADLTLIASTQLPENLAQPLPEPSASAPQLNPVPLPADDVAEAATSVVSLAVTSTDGAYGVQLTSLPDEVSARLAYAKISANFADILSPYEPIIKRADVPGKGIFYRVFAGPINSYADANDLCARLRSAGISGCFARKM
ncbi:MAG: SPOR domain-containing protein [Rhizobiales bacterium]|nr:SPOR domain-containing protein [Hyphomicrobiales bacterium]NRB14992.1 SPOR domain-containing protein [Hyphomicrobiales bacterium]